MKTEGENRQPGDQRHQPLRHRHRKHRSRDGIFALHVRAHHHHDAHANAQREERLTERRHDDARSELAPVDAEQKARRLAEVREDRRVDQQQEQNHEP